MVPTMKTILVTGSEGNIGQYLVSALNRLHPDWLVLRLARGSQDRPSVASDKLRYTGDLRDPAVIERVLEDHRIDVLLHAASTSYSHVGYRAHPYDVLDNDCRMTLNLLRHASSFKKVVYLSSALAYEHADVPDLTEELTSRIPAPTSSYGVAKYLGEQAVRLAHEQTGVPYTIWRPFNVVSPLEPIEGEGRHVFVDFFRRLFIEQVAEFRVLGSGRQVRCFIWVEEVAECIVRALDDPLTDNQTLNLARDEPMTLIELKDLLISIGRELGVLQLEYSPPVVSTGSFAGIEMMVRVPSVARLERITGWRSCISVHECMHRFVAAKLAAPSAGQASCASFR